MGGASVIQQALNAGLLDQICLHVVPVLLGDGTPLFAHLRDPIKLEQLDMLEGHRVRHLKYRVIS